MEGTGLLQIPRGGGELSREQALVALALPERITIIIYPCQSFTWQNFLYWGICLQVLAPVTRCLIMLHLGLLECYTCMNGFFHMINVWVLPSSGNTISEEFSLTLPAEVLEGSGRVTFSVIGEKGFLCSWVCSEKTCTKLWPYWCIDPAPHEIISKRCDVGLRNVDHVIFFSIYSSHKEWLYVISKCLEEKAQTRISSLTSVTAFCLTEPKPSLHISTNFVSVIPFPPWYPPRNDSSLYLSSSPFKLPFLLPEP